MGDCAEDPEPLKRIPARETCELNALLSDIRGGVVAPSSTGFLLVNNEPPLRRGLASRDAGDDRL